MTSLSPVANALRLTIGRDFAEQRPTILQDVENAIARGATSVTLDLTATEYADSRGLGVMVQINRRCSRAGIPCVLANLRGDLKHLFDITKLGSLFTLTEDAVQQEAAS